MNVDILTYNTATNVTDYVNSLNSMGCNFFIDRPTRLTSSSATCIDHVYSNQPAYSLDSHILLTDASDHYSTITKIRGLNVDKEEQDIYVRKTTLTAKQWEEFNRKLYLILQQTQTIDYQNMTTNEQANLISEAYRQ